MSRASGPLHSVLMALMGIAAVCGGPQPARAQDSATTAPPETGTAPAQSPAPPPPLPVGRERQFGDWTTVRLEMTASRLCFAVTRSRTAGGRRSTSSATATEAPVNHVHVSSWAEAGIKAEVSVRAAVPLRTGTPAQIVIGSEQFKLFTKSDAAFVENPIDELKLLEAMKKGSQMTFTAQTDEGVTLTDTFSLGGLAGALAHVTQGCP